MKRGSTESPRRAETPAEWLAELGIALRMPYERAEAIREELAEHLRERVRDLELEGLDETAAASMAVKELGDAAAVARRFRNAERTPIRRRIMNLAVIGIAGAALVTSVVAITGGDQPTGSNRATMYQAVMDAGTQEPIAVQPLQVKNGKLEEVLAKLGAEAASRTVVRWSALNELGTDGGDAITFDAPLGDLASAVAAINEAMGRSPQGDPARLEFRVKDGVIEFGPRQMFDRRETVLVCYDIGDLIDAGIELDEMCGAITSFVDSTNWVNNGGDLGQMQVVGRRMFVRAPLRMQEGVQWIIEQLADKEQAAAARPEAGAAAALKTGESKLVYVSGLVARQGPYNHPGEDLTLRRVLIAASIKPDAVEAKIVRGPADRPETVGELPGADLFDPTGADFLIKPGDIVTVK